MYPGPDYSNMGLGYGNDIKPKKSNPIFSNIKKQLPKIFALLVAVGIISWFVFFAPKPGVLRFNMVEIDSENFVDGEITVTRDSKIIGIGNTIEGTYRLSDVPPGELTIQITPNPGHKSKTMNIELLSGEEKNVLVELSRDVALDFEKSAEITIGTGCVANINLNIKNTMDKTEKIEFVPEGDLVEWMSFENGTVEARRSKVFPVKIEVPADYYVEEDEEAEPMIGTLRVKGTDLALEVSAKIVPGGKLEADDGELNFEIVQGEKGQETTELTNVGIGTIADIKANVTGDIASWVKVTIKKSTLKEEETTEVIVNVDVPVNANPGINTGKLIITSGCGNAEIDLKVEVEQLEIELTTIPEEISSTLYAGDYERASITINNPSAIAVDVSFNVRGDISQMVMMEDTMINVPAGRSKTISVLIEPRYEANAGSYSGRIDLTYLGKTINLPVMVKVISENSYVGEE